MAKISVKIKKSIQSEIKALNAYYKSLVNQEINYNRDLKEEKEAVKASIDYYNKVLNEE